MLVSFVVMQVTEFYGLLEMNNVQGPVNGDNLDLAYDKCVQCIYSEPV